MSPLQALVVFVAGVWAGTINTVVGSGTLITFPVLLAVGLPPVTANVSNTLGLAPGSLSGAIGYRAELTGQRPRLVRLGLASVLGGIVGAILLLKLPADAFQAIVPVLIVLALVLVVVQPKLSKRFAARASGERLAVTPLLSAPVSTAATSARPRASSSSRSWACCWTSRCSASTRPRTCSPAW